MVLNKIKDSYANMYFGEILKFKGDEYRTLSFLRLKAGGENGITWYSKEKLRTDLNIGRNKINSILDTLEENGAIIIFNVKDNISKRTCSNIYYICEYDAVNKQYITANTISEIKSYAIEIRNEKEKAYALKNKLKPRVFILEERLKKSERKIKYYNINKEPYTENRYSEPCTENRHMEPCTENGHSEPCTENRYPLNNNNEVNNKKQVNNNNSNMCVYFDTDHISLVRRYVSSNLVSISDDDAKLIISDFNATYGSFDINICQKHIDAVISYKGRINNVVGMLRKAIREKWIANKECCSSNIDSFTNYEQREYTNEQLEEIARATCYVPDEEQIDEEKLLEKIRNSRKEKYDI